MKTITRLAPFAFLVLAHQAFAWDCANPVNWYDASPGNECYHVGPQPGAATSNVLQQPQSGSVSGSQGQGQHQTAQGGAGGVGGAGGLGGASTATGGAGGTSTAQGGSVGAISAQGGAAGNQHQGQGQTANGGQAAGGSVDSHAVSSTYVAAPRLPVETALAGFQQTNAPCRYAEGLGIQTVPAGTSVGLTFKDKDCERFALAQYLYARGQWQAADKVMCKIRAIQDALGSDCLEIIAIQADDGRVYHPPEAPVAAAPIDAVTHKELLEVERRMLQRGVGK